MAARSGDTNCTVSGMKYFVLLTISDFNMGQKIKGRIDEVR
jgi:hypothetical protein